MKEKISLKDFQDMDLCVATIIDVKQHPNADKLWLLKIDLGEEQRQLVAGAQIGKDLVGKQVIVLANLEPALIRGERSEGMLLACEDGTLLMPVKRMPNGTRVK